MAEQKSFYITTTLPYVNSDPHIGFAMEIIRADVIARFKKSQGFDVFFNTGTDEHGQKVWTKSVESGMDVQKYVDGFASKFKDLIPLLGISKDINFIRTTDEHHIKSAEEFWNRCATNGDIYKKYYKINYCIGCEFEKTDSELENGKCILHPNLDMEVREEENYFFAFSKYQKDLLLFYRKYPDFVTPDFRFNEIKAFVERGLEDFSISRLKEKMPWGVPVPGDDAHVMYVWFDALVNYISALGWPENEENFNKFWVNGDPTQYAGKDNLRQQSAMWQAMLMSASLPLSRHIVINGFITSNGQKMSKSLGNVISPSEIVEKYGHEALRYFVCRELSNFEDSDFTWERMNEAYNTGLANGLGNLTSRIMTMATQYGVSAANREPFPIQDVSKWLEVFEIKKAIDEIWWHISDIDKYIADNKPFSLYKTDPEKAKSQVLNILYRLQDIAKSLYPFLPETSEKILNLIEQNKKPTEPLFLRKD